MLERACRLAVVAAAAVVPTTGLHAQPASAACDPGGLCASPVAPALRAVAAAAGLPDLAGAPSPGVRREVRVWGSNGPAAWPAWGNLRRLVEDTAGRVSAEEFSWWAGARPPARAGYAPTADAICRAAPLARVGRVAWCPSERTGMPYAATRLRVLGERGVWRLPGEGGPSRRRARCYDLCRGPGYLVVELWDGGRYRTYGYPLGVGNHPPEAALTLFQDF